MRSQPFRPFRPFTFIASGIVVIWALLVCAVGILQACSGYGPGPTANNANNALPPVALSALQLASIQALSGEGCLQLAKRHPEAISAGIADLSSAQVALDSGHISYDDVLALALNHVRTDPQAMVAIGPVVTAIETILGANGKLAIPIKGTLQYSAIQAGISGCETGLLAVNR